MIVLSGSKNYITENNTGVFRTEGGNLLVYVIAVKEGRRGRRQLLAELPGASLVPSLFYTDEDGILWSFELMALDVEVSLSEEDPGQQDVRENAIRQLAAASGLENLERLGFEEAVAEHYRLLKVKDDAFIYQVQKDDRQFYEQGLKDILHVFAGDGEPDYAAGVRNPLYRAAAYLCGKRGISIESYDNVTKSAGTRFTIEDIARLSNFLVRRVTLEEDWWKKDLGPFLAYLIENDRPIILEPRGPHNYILYDPGAEQKIPVTPEVAQQVSDHGYEIYRALPDRPLKNRDIVRFLLKEISFRDILTFLAMSAVTAGIGLFLAEVNRMLFDSFIPSGNMAGLLQAGGMLLAFTVSNTLFGVVGSLASFRFTASARYHVQTAFYQRMMNLPEHVLNSMESGDAAVRIMGVGSLVCGIADTLLQNGTAILMSLLFLWRMFRYSPAMSSAGILLVLVYLLVDYFFAIRRIRYTKTAMETSAEISSGLLQYISGIEKIRLSGTENNILLQHMRRYIRYKNTDASSDHLTLVSGSILGLISVLMTACFFLVAGMGAAGGTTSSGIYMAFSSAFGSFSGAMMALSGTLLYFKEMGPSWERLKFLLDNAPEASEGQVRPGKLRGQIDVDQLTFSYTPEAGPVIRNLSVHIRPGEYVGIVGASGCGKSTFMRLLLGFEKPDKGKIYYDGNDLDVMDKRELRKKMGTVLQNGSLISGSISENISIVAPDVSFERIEEVVREVGLEEDVKDMPMGLSTMVSDDNMTISGGQKQRILIARALASDPSILLFDEATSALDNITQKTVCDTLEKIRATRIVIAHRLSTIMHCDRILVMDQGRIAEEGSYEELMAAGGLFAEMAKRQIV